MDRFPVQIRVVAVSTAAKKKASRLCQTKFCRRRARAQRSLCNTCTCRLWRARNPIRALYCNLRTHAKERGKEFTLTFEQWQDFCQRTDYHELKGRRPSSSTVDRIRPWEGYSAGNIRVLTHAANSARQDAAPTWDDMAAVAAVLESGGVGNPF